MRTLPPAILRKIKARAVEKGIPLKTVARRAAMPATQVSNILAGRLVHPVALKKITRVIDAAPMPE